MSAKESNRCLGCRELKPLHIRGLCVGCYHQMRRTLKLVPEPLRQAAEQKLVDAGRLLPRHSGNPFAEELAEFLNPGAPGTRPLAPHEQEALNQATGPGAADGLVLPRVPPKIIKKTKRL